LGWQGILPPVASMKIVFYHRDTFDAWFFPLHFMSWEIPFQTGLFFKKNVFLLFSIKKMDFSDVMNLFKITAIHPLPGYRRIGRAP
jgi:hypothetical protein